MELLRSIHSYRHLSVHQSNPTTPNALQVFIYPWMSQTANLLVFVVKSSMLNYIRIGNHMSAKSLGVAPR